MSSSTDSNEKINNNITNIKELIKYGFWGGVTTAINLLAFFCLESAGMFYILANVLSYIFAVFVNYFLNKKFVFNTGSPINNDRVQLLKFFSVRLSALLVDNVLFYLLVSILGFNVIFSRVFLSLVIIIATFGINKSFVFTTKKR